MSESITPGWENPPYTSFTTGYRAPEYNPEEQDSNYLIYALKSFPMSPNSNELSMQVVRNYVLKARDLVINELIAEAKDKHDSEFKDKQSSVKQPIIRTTDKWFGDNEYIPLQYLIPAESEECSVEEMLKNTPFCSHLSNQAIKKLVDNGTTQTTEREAIVCSEGEFADNVYLITKGSVKIFKENNDGDEIEIAIIEKGNMFGEMALFDQGIRCASVKCNELCEFFIFKGETFLELLLG